MQSASDFPYIINFRWWRKGQLFQKQVGFRMLNRARMQVSKVAKICADNKCDWLAEIFPRFGKPIVQGSQLGLKHYRDLF